jgi:hypothetical protein
MRKKGMERFRKSVELFDEKSNDVVRKINFKSSKDFDQFLEDFSLMRYPGYDWEYVDKRISKCFIFSQFDYLKNAISLLIITQKTLF